MPLRSDLSLGPRSGFFGTIGHGRGGRAVMFAVGSWVILF